MNRNDYPIRYIRSHATNILKKEFFSRYCPLKNYWTVVKTFKKIQHSIKQYSCQAHNFWRVSVARMFFVIDHWVRYCIPKMCNLISYASLNYVTSWEILSFLLTIFQIRQRSIIFSVDHSLLNKQNETKYDRNVFLLDKVILISFHWNWMNKTVWHVDFSLV